MITVHAQERLFVPIHTGWKSIHTDKQISAFIPTAENDNAWSRQITIKKMPNNNISPELYEDNIQAEMEKSESCTKYATAEPIKILNKYFTESVLTFQCLQENGSSKIFMSKALNNTTDLYEVRYSFITDDKGMYNNISLKAYLAQYVSPFMQLVTLCDDSIKERRCPLVK